MVDAVGLGEVSFETAMRDVKSRRMVCYSSYCPITALIYDTIDGFLTCSYSMIFPDTTHWATLRIISSTHRLADRSTNVDQASDEVMIHPIIAIPLLIYWLKSLSNAIST